MNTYEITFTREFLSTPSARRATRIPCDPVPRERISIHALREEGDVLQEQRIHQKGYFYPRPPRGGRRRAMTNEQYFKLISIHALREEGDGRSPTHQPPK